MKKNFLVYLLTLLILCGCSSNDIKPFKDLNIDSVTKITIKNGNPPFDVKECNFEEIDKIVKVLNKLELNENETYIVEGEGFTLEIVTNNEVININIVSPYIGIDGKQYKLESNSDIFKVIESIK